MGADYGAGRKLLLFHSEVRWLSQDKVLKRVYELRTEVQDFLASKKHSLAFCFDDTNWLAQVCYLRDFFAHLDQPNLSMQGKNAT